MEFRVYHLPSTWMLSPSRKLSKPCSLGIFMEASLHRHDWLLTQSPAPPPSPEDGGWGWKFQASNHTLTFLVPVSILKLSSSPPRVTSLEQKTFITQGIPRTETQYFFSLTFSLSSHSGENKLPRCERLMWKKLCSCTSQWNLPTVMCPGEPRDDCSPDHDFDWSLSRDSEAESPS